MNKLPGILILPVTTEQLHPDATGLDARPLSDVADQLIRSQVQAAAVVQKASAEIAKGASVMAQTLLRNGTLYFIAAGSSGLMAAADAQELGGTFSVPATQLRIVMAGGLPQGVEMPGDTEDMTDGLERELKALKPVDTVILVSASGTTPFTLRAAEIAKAAGASLVGIANNPGSALLLLADVSIALATPPELLSGSTRLGAGTAQKIALNTLSTTMAVDLGHVYDGMMVNLRADNAKLRRRATGIIARIADVDHDQAQSALEHAKGDVKLAALMAAQGTSLDRAVTCLEQTNGNLRAALAEKT